MASGRASSGRKTLTKPANNCPTTSARLIPSAATSTSCEVMPPFGDHPRRVVAEQLSNDRDQAGRDGAGDAEALFAVAAGAERPAGHEQDVPRRQGTRRGRQHATPDEAGTPPGGPAAPRRRPQRARCRVTASRTSICRFVRPTCEPTTTRPCPPGRPSGQMLRRVEGCHRVEPGEDLNKGGSHPVEEGTTCVLGRQQAEDHDLEVGVVDTVDHHEPAVVDAQQDLGDPFGTAPADVVQGNAVDVVRARWIRDSSPRGRAGDPSLRSRRWRHGRTRSGRRRTKRSPTRAQWMSEAVKRPASR